MDPGHYDTSGNVPSFQKRSPFFVLSSLSVCTKDQKLTGKSNFQRRLQLSSLVLSLHSVAHCCKDRIQAVQVEKGILFRKTEETRLLITYQVVALDLPLRLQLECLRKRTMPGASAYLPAPIWVHPVC